MQILTHTSDNQGQTKSVPVDVLIDSGACDGSYISSALAIQLNKLCVEIYPQREWIGGFVENGIGVVSNGYVEVKMQFFDVLTQQISYFVVKLNIIDNPIFDVIIGRPTIDKHQLSMRANIDGSLFDPSSSLLQHPTQEQVLAARDLQAYLHRLNTSIATATDTDEPEASDGCKKQKVMNNATGMHKFKQPEGKSPLQQSQELRQKRVQEPPRAPKRAWESPRQLQESL